jgi:hypothetical protein
MHSNRLMLSDPSNPPGPCEPRVLRVDRIAFICEPSEWPFTSRCRGAIDTYFQREKRPNASLWNGRLLLARDLTMADGVLLGNASRRITRACSPVSPEAKSVTTSTRPHNRA